jgi:hypothetical protein
MEASTLQETPFSNTGLEHELSLLSSGLEHRLNESDGTSYGLRKFDSTS